LAEPLEWEKIKTKNTANIHEEHRRAKVPNGWLYQIIGFAGDGTIGGMGVTFIHDPGNAWRVDTTGESNESKRLQTRGF